MQKITKGTEPSELACWKRQNRGGTYDDLPSPVRQAIRLACVTEQHGLCAFCCNRVTAKICHNAHLQSRTRFRKDSLRWDNIVASCNNDKTCGTRQGQQTPPLSPLTPECETELRFWLDGSVEGTTTRASDTITILNLNDNTLRLRRRQAIRDFFWLNDYFPPEEDPRGWDAEIWQGVIDACCTPDASGNLAPFAPVLVNIGRQLLRPPAPQGATDAL